MVSKASTIGKIGDILEYRGELDEALNIRQTEELPVYEKVGDVRAKAITKGKIAGILAARGELEEAVRIREIEQLPVFEELGAVPLLIVGRVQLGITLWRKDAGRHRDEVQSLLRSALKDAQRLCMCEAEQIEAILAQYGLE